MHEMVAKILPAVRPRVFWQRRAALPGCSPSERVTPGQSLYENPLTIVSTGLMRIAGLVKVLADGLAEKIHFVTVPDPFPGVPLWP